MLDHVPAWAGGFAGEVSGVKLRDGRVEVFEVEMRPGVYQPVRSRPR